ncbi:MAG: acetyl-CoA carboxylase biotin carboxyl carrier protein [Ruminococcus sp.]|nr:acetyl-CoA carboxylase biotin carboxyl carrier protein [Ruminococcus sp.]
MFNIEEIKKLITLLEDSSLSVLEVESDDNKVRLEKATQGSPMVSVANNNPVVAASEAAVPEVAVPEASADAESGRVIKAPIVGVFYVAPSPESDPYVTVGKKVKKGDVVCIIEAMKCMNEIQAEEDGEITAVLANNSDLVEYGQPLFSIK